MGLQKTAVQKQLGRWGPTVSDTPLAALALGLAAKLDGRNTPATAYAAIARELHSVLADLEKAAPKQTVRDTVQTRRDELAARRGRGA